MNNKKGFSIIEIIITISIVVLLAIIGISSKKGYDENVSNTKVEKETNTINSALVSYIQEYSNLPMPGGNTNFFSIDTSYVHSFDDPDTFGVYGSLTEETLPKKYLDNLPLDPRTNSYYAYGITKDSNKFEVASIQVKDSVPNAKVIGNYTAENGPYNLIRAYNGPNFVSEGSEIFLPYNPDELIMIATDKDGKIYREGDTINVPIGEELELFFSDGSVSIIGDNTKETILKLNQLNFKGNNNLNTKIKLALESGKIWTKATKLNNDSEFEVYTSDTSATVRGTIFGVEKSSQYSKIIVNEGEVYILDKPTNENILSGSTNNNIIFKGSIILERLKVIKGEKNKEIKTKNNNLYGSIIENENEIIPIFSINTEIRSEETVNNLVQSQIIETNTCIGYVTSIGECCKSFDIEGICQDNQADTNITSSGYTLYAYAPFNYAGDINMYSSGNINVEHNSIIDNSVLLPNICSDGSNILKSFCKISDSIKGVFIDNNLNDDKLKYSDLNLTGDFAIEMNVSKEAFNTSTTRYIFDNYKDGDIPNSGKGLFINNYGNIIGFNGVPTICTSNCFTNNELNTDFIKIIIKNGIELNIGGKSFSLIDKNINISNLFVGSKYNGYNQINGIIDYIKIYKK